jgi:transposase-like protein
MRESDQHEEDERHRGQQRIERQGAGQERDVVFVSGLKSTGKKTGGRAIPPAGS